VAYDGGPGVLESGGYSLRISLMRAIALPTACAALMSSAFGSPLAR
jgi:hypothetical protein